MGPVHRPPPCTCACRRTAAAVAATHCLRAGLALLLLLASGAAAQAVELPVVCKAGADTFLPDTDLWDGDLVPTIAVEAEFDLKPWGREGVLFQDYVVSASSAESCCTQCWLHPGERSPAGGQRRQAEWPQRGAASDSSCRPRPLCLPQTAEPSPSRVLQPATNG